MKIKNLENKPIEEYEIIDARDLALVYEGNLVPDKLRKYLQSPHQLFSVRYCIIKGEVRFEKKSGLHSLFIDFIDCIFEDWVHIEAKAHPAYLGFRRCEFQQSIIIGEGTYASLSFNDCWLEHHIQVNDGKFEKLTMEFRSDEAGLSIMRGEYKRLFITKCALRYISIELDEASGDMSIDSSRTSSLEIHGKLKAGCDLSISNIDCRDFEFKRFQNDGRLNIFRVTADKSLPLKKYKPEKWKELPKKIRMLLETYFKSAKFIIFHSSLGNATINNVDLTSFDKTIIKDSNFSGSSFTGMKWSKTIEVFSLEDDRVVREKFTTQQLKENKKDKAEKREIYRQLKLNAIKQNDSVAEQYFHSLEMSAYLRTLNPFSKDISTIVVLGLSYLTSNFGQSLSRPLISILLGHGLLFSIALCFEGFSSVHYDLNHPTAEGFKSAFENYFIYINPFRRVETAFTGYLIVVDLAMRIWSSYMIYNIIRATRRFLK